MSVSLSMLGAQVAAASPSPSPSTSSGFTWGDAALIFVLVIVGLLILVAFVGRRTQRLTYRPRLRTERDAEVREAAEQDVEAIEDDSWITRRDVPGSREDDL
jgi:hypothetical protein